MKKVFVLVMVLLLPIPISAQEGKIVIISERVGEKIDVQERNYYKLWGDIKGFQSAVFLQTEEGYIAKITYFEDEQEKVLSLDIPVGLFRWLTEYIDHFEEIEAGTYKLKGYEVHRQPAIEPSRAELGIYSYVESFVAALGGTVLGAVGGAYAGMYIAAITAGPDIPEDALMAVALIGALYGAIIGASVGCCACLLLFSVP